MKVTQISVTGIGMPSEPCSDGGEWLPTQPGDLVGYRCSVCGRLDWGEITFDEPQEVELEVTATENSDGSATIRFGESR